MNWDSLDCIPAYSLRQVDKQITTTLFLGFENTFDLTLCAFNVSLGIDVILYARFKARQSVHWYPNIVIDKIH